MQHPRRFAPRVRVRRASKSPHPRIPCTPPTQSSPHPAYYITGHTTCCMSTLLPCTPPVHASCSRLLCTPPVHTSCLCLRCIPSVHTSCTHLLLTLSVHTVCSLIMSTSCSHHLSPVQICTQIHNIRSHCISTPSHPPITRLPVTRPRVPPTGGISTACPCDHELYSRPFPQRSRSTQHGVRGVHHGAPSSMQHTLRSTQGHIV